MADMMKLTSDAEIDAYIVRYAKSFTVVQMNPGGFVSGSRNYLHHSSPTIEEARELARTLYEEDSSKRNIIIYALADIGYVKDMSRPVENYPAVKGYMSKAERARLERANKPSGRRTRARSGE